MAWSRYRKPGKGFRKGERNKKRDARIAAEKGAHRKRAEAREKEKQAQKTGKSAESSNLVSQEFLLPSDPAGMFIRQVMGAAYSKYNVVVYQGTFDLLQEAARKRDIVLTRTLYLGGIWQQLRTILDWSLDGDAKIINDAYLRHGLDPVQPMTEISSSLVTTRMMERFGVQPYCGPRDFITARTLARFITQLRHGDTVWGQICAGLNVNPQNEKTPMTRKAWGEFRDFARKQLHVIMATADFQEHYTPVHFYWKYKESKLPIMRHL